MSIYGGRKAWKDFNDVYQKTVAGESAHGESIAAVVASDEWLALRKAAPANYLLPSTLKWVQGLPADVYPATLAIRYPRIVNLIAAQWNDRGDCPLLFDDLLGDRRGGRTGFSPDAHRDIVGLQEYWYNGHGLR
jgi:hypothetical protein